jgi:hypothetical protein
MAKDHGVLVYEIYPNGCLNGIYADTNRLLENKIFNEILKKRNTEIDSELTGNYKSVCIDFNETIIEYDVSIREKGGKIQILWSIDNVQKYEGTGWRTRENQLTVSYRQL